MTLFSVARTKRPDRETRIGSFMLLGEYARPGFSRSPRRSRIGTGEFDSPILHAHVGTPPMVRWAWL